MSATINGIPVNFGFQGALGSDKSQGITLTTSADASIPGILLQSAELTNVADMEETRSGQGDVVVHAWYNQHQEASLEYIVAGDTLAHTISPNSTLQTPGALIKITACTSVPDLVATTWEVQSGVKISGSNTTAKRVTLPLRKYAGITAVAT